MTIDLPEASSSGAMSLLQAKLHQPHVTRQLVTRFHLRERLGLGLDGQLIVVAASAGYGKTTLISSWLEGRATRSDLSEVQSTSKIPIHAGDKDHGEVEEGVCEQAAAAGCSLKEKFPWRLRNRHPSDRLLLMRARLKKPGWFWQL